MVVDWLCPGLRPSGNRRPRLLHCKVILLDEHELLQDILSSNLGQELLDRVFRHLNLLETAYFGLRYLDHENQTQWLDPSKKIGKQLKTKKGDLNPDAHTLYFCVKFYAADPCKLVEEITRYQFFLQVKQDILQGRLPVSFDLAAELGAYVVQSELGDYDPRRHSYGYVSEFRFLANQTSELETRIAELHKTLVGQLPSAAELNYLDKVKWLEMYGVDLHPVLGEDCVEYFLGLTPNGIILLRNKTKVGNYYWPRINKIYHKGKYFMLRVNEKNSTDRTHGFETPSRGACRHLFRCCIDHQAFFRLMASGPPPLSPYSRFRSYSPPTMTGANNGSSINEKQQQLGSARRMAQSSFQRMPSRRAQRRVVEGQEMNAAFVEGPVSQMVASSIGQSVNCLAHGGSVASRNNPSPRSVRSAPWTQSQPRGMYTSSSPRSVRSCGTAPALLNRLNRRSSSVESQSSADSHSRGHRRRSHSRSHRKHNRQSDCESQLSRGSTQKSGHRKHRRRHRSSRHSSRHEMVDSAPQWREAQRRKGEIIQRAVISTTEPRRRHRSKHRSPSSKHPLPDELRKHLEFDLVDTTGMSEQQRREIAYTVVQSQLAHHRQQQQLHQQQMQQQQQQQQQHQQHLQHHQHQSHNHQYQPVSSHYPHNQQHSSPYHQPPQQQNSSQQNSNHHQHHHQLQHQHHGLPSYASQSVLQTSSSRLDDIEVASTGARSVRSVGFSVKRDRRTAYQCHESTASNFVVLSRTSSRIEPISRSSSRHDLYSSRKESSSSSSLAGPAAPSAKRSGSVCRIPISTNADSGLGESTTQDFSSCCSSSADSTKHTRATQRQFDEDGFYKHPSETSKHSYSHGDATLDAVLQPIISTLTRRRRTKPK